METEQKNLLTCHILAEKGIKNLEISELIRKKEIISRTDISKLTGINIVSVSNYIKTYIDKKLVLEKGLGASSGGRKPELVELDAEESSVVGIDVGRQEAKVVLANLAMAVIEKLNAPIENLRDKELCGRLTDLVKEIMKKSNVAKDRIRGIGIGIRDNSFLSIGSRIEEELGIETFIAGHAACGALGEKRLNSDADVENMLYMYSDVGRGVILKGSACVGAIGNMGELQISDDTISHKYESELIEHLKYLRPWNESLGLIGLARREVSRGVGTLMVDLAKGEINNITENVVIEAAKAKDDMASNIMHSVAINLGLRIAYLINLFDPAAVVIGGGVEKAGELVLDTVKKAVGKLAFNKQAEHTRIMLGKLGEDAVSLGAVSLAIREVFIRA